MSLGDKYSSSGYRHPPRNLYNTEIWNEESFLNGVLMDRLQKTKVCEKGLEWK